MYILTMSPHPNPSLFSLYIPSVYSFLSHPFILAAALAVSVYIMNSTYCKAIVTFFLELIIS